MGMLLQSCTQDGGVSVSNSVFKMCLCWPYGSSMSGGAETESSSEKVACPFKTCGQAVELACAT